MLTHKRKEEHVTGSHDTLHRVIFSSNISLHTILIIRVRTGFGKSWKVMEIEKKKKIPGPGKVLEIFFF